MIFSKKNHELIRQNEDIVKKPQKHDANLQKNSTLYFQVGLIICLLFTYGALEMNFKAKSTDLVFKSDLQDELDEYTMDEFEIYQEKVEEIIEPVKKKPKHPEEFDVRKDDDQIKESVLDDLFKEEIPKATDKKFDPSTLDIPKEPTGPINIIGVEMVPIYPGCEKASNNDERRACMASKISKLIQKKFDTDIATELGLSGMQKINVKFKINKQGEVEILKTQAPHSKLEKEATRVVKKIPTMTPGKQSNKNVEVLYYLPIRFNIQN